jgi:hypothetical protein
MPDITMNVDDTLELDAIIQKWDAKSNNTINVTEGSDYKLSGFQTHTGVFDPQSSGDYTIKVNGQELSIKVNESNAIPDSEIDRFEDGDLSEYVSSSGWSVQQTTVLEGSFTAKGTTTNTNGYTISSTSGLPRYPAQGYEHRVLINLSQASSSGQLGVIIYAAQSETGGANARPNGYYLTLSPANNEIQVGTSLGGTDLGTVNVSEFNASTTYDLRLEWTTSDSHTIRLLDLSRNELGSGTFTDSTYTSGGIGYSVNSVGGGQTIYIDDVARRSL